MKDENKTKTQLIKELNHIRQRMAELEASDSNRMQTELNLQRRRDFPESLIETAQTIVLVLDLDGKIVRINPYMEAISGYQLQEVQGKDWFHSFLPERDRERIRALFLKAINDIRIRGHVNPIVTKEGKECEVEWHNKTLKDARGKTVGLLCIGQDVTKRKRMIEALQHRLIAEEILTTISSRFINLAPENVDNAITSALRTIGEFAGVDRFYINLFSKNSVTINKLYTWHTEELKSRSENLIGLSLEHFHWLMPKLKRFESIKISAVADLPPEAGTEKEFCRAYSIKSILLLPLVIDNALIGILGVTSECKPREWLPEDIRLLKLTGDIFLNVMARKQAECLLRQSEEKFSSYLKNSPTAIFIVDEKCNNKFVNQAACELTGFSEDELLRMSIIELGHPEKLVKSLEAFSRLPKDAKVNMEIAIRKKNNSLTDVILDAVQVSDDRYMAFCTDISKRKQVEERIKASLLEKEVLLREIHHRVKNNLQVISSLLNLQAGKIKDKHTLSMFKESQDRVRSMALIHEGLYQAKDLANIDFAAYVRNLARQLLNSYAIDPHAIRLNLNIKDVFMDINTAIPCGLIINELVSNALKHAFIGDRKGEVCINFHKNDDKIYLLTIADNGVGFPTELDFRKCESLGLQLVVTLVEQLNGSIELDRDNGTAFKVCFKKTRV